MIRRRLAVAVVAAVAAVLGVAGFVVVNALEARLIGDVDDELAARIAEVARENRNRGFPGFPGPRSGRSPYDVRELAFVLLDTDGQAVAAIPSGPASDPDPLPDLGDVPESGRPTTVGSEGSGHRYRVVAFADRGGGALVVGLSLADVDESVDNAQQILLLAGAIVLAAVAALAWLVMREGLRPIDDMIVTAGRIADGDLRERATVVNPSDEVGQLGTALNTMLDRISEAVDAKSRSEDRMRRFVADASHELRTPLTSIRGYAELYRSAEGDTDAAATAIRRIEDEATRMGVLVEDLLVLARLDQGRPLERADVDVAQVVGEAVDAARVVDPDRVIDLDLPAAPAVVVGDPHRLRQVIDNLLANVRHHTPTGTDARVNVTRDGGCVRVTVADDGPGMSDDEVAHAFERFWQAEQADGATTRGTGLGLAIVAELVAAHDGRTEIHSAPGAGTTIEVVLPALEAAE